jgi:hypothetical protein
MTCSGAGRVVVCVCVWGGGGRETQYNVVVKVINGVASKASCLSNVRPRLVHRLVVTSSQFCCSPGLAAVGRHVNAHNPPAATRVCESLGVNGLPGLVRAWKQKRAKIINAQNTRS